MPYPPHLCKCQDPCRLAVLPTLTPAHADNVGVHTSKVSLQLRTVGVRKSQDFLVHFRSKEAAVTDLIDSPHSDGLVGVADYLVSQRKVAA